MSWTEFWTIVWQTVIFLNIVFFLCTPAITFGVGCVYKITHPQAPSNSKRVI